MTQPIILADWSPSQVAIGLFIVFVAFLFFCFILVLTKQYKRSSSHRALVVYGRFGRGVGFGFKLIHGGAAFVWPLIQDYAYLELEPISVEIARVDLVTADSQNVRTSAYAIVAIDPTPAVLQQAAIHLVGLPESEIKSHAEDILRNGLQRQLTNLKCDELPHKREQLRSGWQTAVEPDLAKIGLKIIRADITAIDCNVPINNS